MNPDGLDLPRHYTVAEVAAAMRVQPRWVRERCAEGAEHMRYGKRIMFTAEQVEKLMKAHTKTPVRESITTGRKRRSA